MPVQFVPSFDIHRVAEVTSTNTQILENEAWISTPGFVLVATHQTAGKGQVGRKWFSLPGQQLQFSVVLHFDLSMEALSGFSLFVGLVVARALEKGLGFAPELKWPNDVLVKGRKICGILLEGKPDAEGRPRLVVGVGINCGGKRADFPEELQGLLTTLEEESGRKIAQETLMTEVLAGLKELWQAVNEGKRLIWLENWRAYANIEGKQVRYSTPEGKKTGKVIAITDEGHLRVKTPEGREHLQVSGNLEWITP